MNEAVQDDLRKLSSLEHAGPVPAIEVLFVFARKDTVKLTLLIFGQPLKLRSPVQLCRVDAMTAEPIVPTATPEVGNLLRD